MSRTITDEQADSRYDPYSTGRDLYRRENDGFDDIVKNMSKTANPSDENANIARARAAESTAGAAPVAASGSGFRSDVKNIASRLVLRGHLKGKTPTVAALSLLLAAGMGGSFLASSPFFGLIQFKELLSKELNDQLAAADLRSAALMRTKLKTSTNGVCTAKVNIKCRFATLTDRQAAKFKAAGITVERDMSKGFGGKRGQIVSMNFTDPKTNQPVSITDARQLQHYTKNDMSFRSMLMTGYNPQFETLRDSVARAVYRAAGATKRPVISGDTDEERQKSLNTAVEKKASLNAKNLRPVTNDKGEPTGQYTDDKGGTYSQAEYDEAKASGERILASGGSAKFLKTALIGVGVVGTIDTACTVNNTLYMVESLSKVEKQSQAIRFATATIMNPADQIKAGDADEGVINYVSTLANETDARTETVDETKWMQDGSNVTPPMSANPEFGKNMYDSYGYHLVQYGTAPDLNARAQRFMIGGGLTGTFVGVREAIAKVLPDRATVRSTCKIVQNPVVRLGSLAIGVLAGAGSMGLTQVLGISGSLAIGMALPYLESIAADVITGNLFKDLSGLDMGDAAFVGVAGLMGGVAMKRGMKPLKAQEAAKVVAQNRQTEEDYAKVARYQARDTPFDVNNQYSFMGSLVRSVVPYTRQANQSVAMAATSLANLLPASLSAMLPSAKALSTERFTKCKDQGYADVGIDADQFCNVRYGLSEAELAIDPLENVQWMIDSGNIDGDSEDGAARDNGKSWNYQKFLKECVNRTVGWGDDTDENQGNGANCTSEANEADNQHFRVFTFDKSVDASMDAEPPAANLPGTTGATSGATGLVSAEGWAFPTTPDALITSGYKSADRADHRGIDIAHAGDAMGKSIFAARDGKVIAAGPASGFGNWIVLDHGNVIDGKPTYTLYGHMYNEGVLVQQGQTVKAGQEIGRIGNMGNSSGAHLHYELWVGQSPTGNRSSCPIKNDCSINPTAILEASRKQAPVDRRRDV